MRGKALFKGLWCLFVLALVMVFSPGIASAYGHFTISSPVPADVFIDNDFSASISATQSLKLVLAGPRSYVIGVKAKDSGKTFQETINVGADQNEHREINAFSEPAAKPGITVFSSIPAEVFLDNRLMTAVDQANPAKLLVPGAGSYVLEVRAKGSNLIHREAFRFDPSAGKPLEIRAFGAETPGTTQASVTETPASGTPAKISGNQDVITREEMNAAIQQATAKAKADALAEEAARRKRQQKRDLTNKGIAHVVGVEANRKLPSSVKNMERIKTLIELIPTFKK